jgi:Xaa-Pro dipeptidase
MWHACHEASLASMHALKPGFPIGQVFDVHARVLDHAGFQDHRLNACGYSLGALHHPNWMDWPMLYAGNPELAAPNMVFFLHMILADSDTGLAMTLGQTVRVTESGCEPLSRAPLELVEK